MAATPDNQIVELLLKTRQAGERTEIPDAEPPRDNDAAYAIQDAVAGSLGPIGGWKVGASSPDAEPLCAPLPLGLMFDGPVGIPSDRFTVLGLEAEVAFRIARDLPPMGRDYERDEIEDAIAAALPAIEVVDSRWRGWPDIPATWHLADHQSNGALVLGPDAANWRDFDLLRQPVRLVLNGRTVVEDVGGNKGGDLIRLVTWLANHATARTGGLRAGDVVTTGSCTGLSFAEPGARVLAEFGDIGRAEVAFS